MNDVIFTLDKTITNTLNVFLEARDSYEKTKKAGVELTERLQTLRVDAKLIKSSMGDGKMRSYAENQLKAGDEFLRRIKILTGKFENSQEKTLEFIKKIRVQIAMIQSQLRHQYDIIAEPEVMEMITENIKTISNLINNVSHKVGIDQSDMVIARELVNKIRDIERNVSSLISETS